MTLTPTWPCSTLRLLLLGAGLAAIAGCAGTTALRPQLTIEQLLAAPAQLIPLPKHRPVSADTVLQTDATMRRFVARNVDPTQAPRFKLIGLLSAMQSRGLFSLNYITLATGTVRETFYGRKANCLSFTMLFVTLAREAGLQAGYEIVDVPPAWSAKSGVVIQTTHINARIKRGPDLPDFVVDFNGELAGGRYPRREVDDRYVLALFYNNIGAEALLAKHYGDSFLNFKKALEIDAQNASAWTNLGLLYARIGWSAGSEAAYLQSLAIDRENASALNNLTALYTRLGDARQAERYRQRARRAQQRNPYYHYYLARQAQSEQRYDDALGSVKRAIGLKADEPEFYLLRAHLLRAVGEDKRADQSIDDAEKFRTHEVRPLDLPSDKMGSSAFPSLSATRDAPAVHPRSTPVDVRNSENFWWQTWPLSRL